MNKPPSAYVWILAATLLWCGSILLYPGLVRAGQNHLSFAIRFFFSHICHQKPERSLAWQGLPLPVCSRCLAAYAGWTLAVLLFPLLRKAMPNKTWPLAGFLIAAALMFLEALLQWLGVWAGTSTRMLTGGGFGFFLGMVVLEPIWRDRSRSGETLP
jgi:uncharacterized membrane protein